MPQISNLKLFFDELSLSKIDIISMSLFKLISHHRSNLFAVSFMLLGSVEMAAAEKINSRVFLPNPSPVVSSPIAQAIAVKKVEIIGSTILTSAEIAAISKTIEGQQVTPEQIEKIAQSVTQIYADRGYITSQAVVDTDKTANGIVTIKVIEGRIEKIEIVGLKNTNPDYVRSRLELGTGTPLNLID